MPLAGSARLRFVVFVTVILVAASTPVAAGDTPRAEVLPSISRLFQPTISFETMETAAQPGTPAATEPGAGNEPGSEPAPDVEAPVLVPYSILKLETLATSTNSASQLKPLPPTVPTGAQLRGLPGRGRFPILASLYVSHVGLQAADVLSTSAALERGGREMNPFLPFASNKAAMFAVKAAASAATIYLSEKMARKNRVGSIVMMAAINSAYAMIVAHNYRVARSLR